MIYKYEGVMNIRGNIIPIDLYSSTSDMTARNKIKKVRGNMDIRNRIHLKYKIYI